MDILRVNQYSRINAVNYATRYALYPNPAFKYFPIINNSSGDCTNFVSQCLNAGNAPMNYNPNNPWWYNTRVHSWSQSWTVAHTLYWHLKVNAKNKSSGIKGLEVWNKQALELGDLVFYENYQGRIIHAAIITAFKNNEPLVSHHSYEALNVSYQYTEEPNHPHFIKIII